MSETHDDKGREIEDVNAHVELDEAALIRETMVGEYMELTLKAFKELPDVWSKIPEREQAKIIQRLHHQAIRAIGQVVKLVASGERTTIKAHLVNPRKGKKEITAGLEIFLNEEHQQTLFDFANKNVLLVLVDEEDFISDEGLPEADDDQQPLNGF